MIRCILKETPILKDNLACMMQIINIIKDIESSSKRIVPKDSYYIVRLKVVNSIIDDMTVAKKLLSSLVLTHHPLVSYISSFKDEIWFLFSNVLSTDDHNFGGCHHEIVSYFSSHLTSELKGKIVKCWIVELNSRNKVIEYFHTIVFTNMMKKCGHKHDTFEDAMENFPKETWQTLPNDEKYGVFYKHPSISLSEEIDYKHIDKYQKFFFE